MLVFINLFFGACAFLFICEIIDSRQRKFVGDSALPFYFIVPIIIFFLVILDLYFLGVR